MCEFPYDLDWKLIYRASEHGFASADFHRQCDNSPNTLTIIKTTNGNIFGGYTEAFWDQTNSYNADPNAFLFSLVNKNEAPIKMKILEGKNQRAIACLSKQGPVFGHFNGTGYDICISDGCNANLDSYCNLGHAYCHPSFSVESLEAKEFLAGTHKFQVEEIEIFQRIN